MRILIVPWVNKMIASGDSNIIQYRTVLKGLEDVKNEKNWYYVVMPKVKEADKVFEDFNNVSLIYANREFSGCFYDEGFLLDKEIYELFNMRLGKYCVDVALNSKVNASPQLYRLLADFRECTNKEMYSAIPVVNMIDREFGEKYTHSIIDYYEFGMRALSYSMFKTIFFTDFEMEIAMESYADFLSPSMIRKMRSNADLVYVGTALKDVDEKIKDVEKFQNFTLMWGGRISAQKRADFVLELYKRVYESGLDVDIVITCPSVLIAKGEYYQKIKDMLKECKKIRFIDFVDRDTFLKILAASHVWLSASLFEGLSIGHIEMGYSGVPGIVPDRPWSRLIFGDDYPLMYKVGGDEKENVYALLKWVIEHYEEAQEIGNKTRQRILEKFNEKEVFRKLDAILKEEIEKRYGGREKFIFGSSYDTFMLTLKKFENSEFSIYEFMYEFRELFKKKFKMFDARLGFPSMWSVYQQLKKIGAEDLYDSEVPVFRVKEVELDECS